MVERFLSSAVILVPLVAGLGLLVVCAVIIIRNPNVSNRYAILLAVGALLCVAPTVKSLKGWGLEVTRDEFVELKVEINAQEAKIKRIDSTPQVDAPLQNANAANKNTVILIFYSERKDTALKMERHLLQKGYSANAVYTDFSELSGFKSASKGTVTFVYTDRAEDLARQILKELRRGFDLKQVADQKAKKLAATDIQILLY